MKKRNIKRIAALVLAGAMVAGMSTVAFAANGDASGATTTSDNQLVLNKIFVVTNEEGSTAAGLQVAYPSVTYTYSINPLEPMAGASVEDKDGNKLQVKKGVAEAVSLESTEITFKGGVATLDKNGQAGIGQYVKVNVDTDAFTEAGPGIYRYSLKDETADATLAEEGIIRGAKFDDDYVLDVYIHLVDGKPAVAGYVLTKNEVKDITTETGKESGIEQVTVTTYEIVPGTEGEDGHPVLSDTAADLTANDYYQTYNVELAKVVDGTMGDRQNKFAFDAAVTDTDLAYTLQEAGETLPTAVNSTTGAVSTTLKDGETAKIWGLAPMAKIQYKETNNTTGEYTVTAADKNDAALTLTMSDTESATVGHNDTASTAALAVTTDYSATTLARADYTADAGNDKVTYTNTLNDVSPTGVVLRFAPYVAMIGAALFLLVFARRRREDY